MLDVCKDVGDVNVTRLCGPRDILVSSGIDHPLYFYFIPLILMIVAFRVIGYVILRYRPTKIL